jgi:hypothetical protein
MARAFYVKMTLISKLKKFDAIYSKIKADQNKSCPTLHRRIVRRFAKMTRNLEVKVVSVPSVNSWRIEGIYSSFFRNLHRIL